MNTCHCGAREAVFMKMLAQSFAKAIYINGREFWEG
jgi:hypothetical protein